MTLTADVGPGTSARPVDTDRRFEPVLVVIPARNEQHTVGVVVRDVIALGLPCLVVDDASSDATAQAAAAAGASVVRRTVQRGVGAALQTGFTYAVHHGYRAVVQVDADGQHPVHSVEELIRTARHTGAALVIGNRFGHPEQFPMSSARRRAVRLFAHLMEPRIGARLADPTSGFRLIGSPLLEHFAVDFPRYYLGDTVEATLLAARLGITPREVPVTMRARQGGEATAWHRCAGGLVRAYVSVLVTSRRRARQSLH